MIAREECALRILADSNIFFKYWKTNEDGIESVFENQDVVVIEKTMTRVCLSDKLLYLLQI